MDDGTPTRIGGSADESLRVIEGGLERELQAEIQTLAGEEWPTFCTLRADDLVHRDIYAAYGADGFSLMFEYQAWTVAIKSRDGDYPSGRGWLSRVNLIRQDRERRHLVVMLNRRTFPTKAQADKVGSLLARAWIDRRGDEEQFQPGRKRARSLRVAGECVLTIEQAAKRLDVTSDALKRWLRRQLEGLDAREGE